MTITQTLCHGLHMNHINTVSLSLPVSLSLSLSLFPPLSSRYRSVHSLPLGSVFSLFLLLSIPPPGSPWGNNSRRLGTRAEMDISHTRTQTHTHADAHTHTHTRVHIHACRAAFECI